MSSLRASLVQLLSSIIVDRTGFKSTSSLSTSSLIQDSRARRLLSTLQRISPPNSLLWRSYKLTIAAAQISEQVGSNSCNCCFRIPFYGMTGHSTPPRDTDVALRDFEYTEEDLPSARRMIRLIQRGLTRSADSNVLNHCLHPQARGFPGWRTRTNARVFFKLFPCGLSVYGFDN